MPAIVTNCHPTLAYECPRQWNRLVPTGRENVRFCHTCSRHVFLCEGRNDAEKYADKGHYIAEEVGELCEQTCG